MIRIGLGDHSTSKETVNEHVPDGAVDLPTSGLIQVSVF